GVYARGARICRPRRHPDDRGLLCPEGGRRRGGRPADSDPADRPPERVSPPNGLEAKGTDGYDGWVRTPHQDWSRASDRFQRKAAMTDAELRIIEFLMTSDATRPGDLPDWLLALLEGDEPEEISHELITAATLIYIRRERPGISLGTARTLIA